MTTKSREKPRRGGPLAPGKLRVGTVVTVSENKHTTDRSLVRTIWEVVAVNEAHVVLRFQAGSRPLDLES